MTRFLLAAGVVFLGASAASADYILVKINVNKLSLQANTLVMPGGPNGQGNPGGRQFQPPPQDPNDPNAAPAAPADDPDARWVYAYVEVKGKVSYFAPATYNNSQVFIYQFEHRWSDKKNWFPLPSKMSALPEVVFNYPPVIVDPLKDFSAKLIREKANRAKTIEGILHLARLALQHGSMKQFHKAMKEAADANPKHGVVQQYLRVKKELELPFDAIDPEQSDLLQDLAENKYRVRLSDQKHYAMHYLPANAGDRLTEGIVRRRLIMLENALEAFYYWFAVQKENSLQPAMPKYRFQVILTNTPAEFVTRNLQWGFEPIVGDGFAPRRDNVVILSAKSRLNDPLYQEFNNLLTAKLLDINTKIQPLGVSLSRDDLLSGKVNENKYARMAVIPIAYAQTAVLLARTLEDQAERLSVSNQAVRQILISARVFPRHVQIPDWMVEGLAAFFETAPGLYPTIGSKSWTHLVSYKHLRNTKDPRLENPTTALFDLVTDRSFQDARAMSAYLRQSPNNNEFRLAARDAWEFARCTAWAYIYYLAQTQKLDQLFEFGKELNKLPRDMDLTESVVQACFARAFAMTDNTDPRRIDQGKLESAANAWTSTMSEANLDNIQIQDFLLQMRAKKDTGIAVPTTKPAVEPSTGDTTTTPPPAPGFQPPMVNPNQPPNFNRPPNPRGTPRPKLQPRRPGGG